MTGKSDCDLKAAHPLGLPLFDPDLPRVHDLVEGDRPKISEIHKLNDINQSAR